MKRIKRLFVAVAYDIENDRKRSRVAKMLEKYGTRINYSVFECMFTQIQFEKIRDSIAQHIDIKTDTVVYYPICLDCYTKIVYQSKPRNPPETVLIL